MWQYIHYRITYIYYWKKIHFILQNFKFFYFYLRYLKIVDIYPISFWYQCCLSISHFCLFLRKMNQVGRTWIFKRKFSQNIPTGHNDDMLLNWSMSWCIQSLFQSKEKQRVWTREGAPRHAQNTAQACTYEMPMVKSGRGLRWLDGGGFQRSNYYFKRQKKTNMCLDVSQWEIHARSSFSCHRSVH